MKKKDMVHTKKSCGSLYDIEYTEDNVPFLRCSGCNHEMRDWEKWEREYSKYWSQKEKWNSKNDGLMCALGYFCHKYESHYGMPFVLSLNEKGLFRGPEVNILRRVYRGLGNSYLGVKSLIDWYFSEKIERRKKRITSLSFLATPFTLNEFKLAYKKSKVITRDKLLPAGMLKWVDDFVPTIKGSLSLKDYGDLKMFLTFFKKDHFQEKEFEMFVDELQRQNIVTQQLEVSGWSD